MVANGETLAFQTSALLEAITERFGTLTISEVAEAMKCGVRGDFGAYFGLCAKSYYQFLKAYQELPERSKSWTAYLDAVEKNQLSDKPVVFDREYLERSARNAFSDYKESGRLPFIPHAVYDTIKDLTGLPTLITQSDWPEVKAQAKKELSAKIPRNMKPLESALLSMDNRTFEFTCKKIALKLYFDSLITAGKEPEFNK